MTESSPWKQAYARLAAGIAAHADIILTENEISIPQAHRDEFYRLFDEVRHAFVEEHLDALPVSARALSDNYCRIEKEVTALLGVEKIDMPMDLHAFLHNPREGLSRSLYNRLFDRLQGKISMDAFESLACGDVAAAATDLFHLGYERWAGLMILRLLEPDQAFFVDLDEDFKPVLTELKEISFGRQAHHPTLRIPEFVVHSRTCNRLVAVKMALARELEGYAVAFKPAVRPKKKTGDTSFALDSRVMLLSFIDGEKDIPVYADIYECKRTPPDWMIEYVPAGRLSDPEMRQQLQRHLQDLNPKFGTSLLVVGDCADAEPVAIAENIRTIAAGFDVEKLRAMVNAVTIDG